jgi:hypothetical protein
MTRGSATLTKRPATVEIWLYRLTYKDGVTLRVRAWDAADAVRWGGKLRGYRQLPLADIERIRLIL